MVKAGSPPTTAPQPRILFAEDDNDVGDFVTEMLQAEGFNVTIVKSGDDGAIAFDSQPFDLLLTDVRMPGTTDGIDLAVYVRQQSPSLPVVIVSGYADELGARLAALGRKVTFLCKPFLIGELVFAIENALVSTAVSTVIFEICDLGELGIFDF